MPLVQGQTALVTLPSNLAPGNYIIRHEIIALQLAQSEGGAEFYPSCTQLKVGGNQTGAPEPDELVLLPGAYKDTDPGIWDQDVCFNFHPFPVHDYRRFTTRVTRITKKRCQGRP